MRHPPQAALYGIPFGGPKIDLTAVVRKLHDFLAANARKLATDVDELLQGTSSEALQEYRRERAALARMDRLEREGSLVRRDVMHERLGRVATHIRGIGEALQRQFGPDAARLLEEALDDMQAEIDGGSAAAIDLGKYLAHWIVVAWCPEGSCHVVDYGRIEVPGAELGVERALLVALRQFREACELGWQRPDGTFRPPELILIDSGYQAPVVYEFVRESGPRYMPAIGRGAGQQSHPTYHPKGIGSQIIWTGEACHVSHLGSEDINLVEANADHWKSFVHSRIAIPLNTAGALSLFHAPPEEHLSLAKHFTSEKQVEEFLAGKGTVIRWVRQSRNNHWFDAAYNASVAGYVLGARLSETPVERAPLVISPGMRRPDGRNWLDR